MRNETGKIERRDERRDEEREGGRKKGREEGREERTLRGRLAYCCKRRSSWTRSTPVRGAARTETT